MTGPGRPPDPGLVDRVQRAACRVYGRQGWQAFSIEAVAREAAVGKASIYLRWSSKEELLTDSLAAQVAFETEVDTGDVREDLRVLATGVLHFYLGEFGDAALRLFTEARLNPDLATAFDAFSHGYIRTARAVVGRAVEREQLSADTKVTELLESLFGAVLLHVVTTTRSDVRQHERYLGSLLDLLVPAQPA